MNRLPYRSDFRLRLAFSDADSLPVSMKGVDVDLWFTTKAGGSVYLAAARSGIYNRCSVLDDGSLLVMFDDHGLQPGQLKAEIAIHADDEALPDGRRDIHLKPVIPIELTDSSCSRPLSGNHTVSDSQPILVNIRLPYSRPDLSHHITQAELENALKALREQINDSGCNLSPATEQEIEAIADIFSNTNH